MISDIFTGFDPAVYSIYKVFGSCFWVSIMLTLFGIIDSYWIFHSPFALISSKFYSIISDQSRITFSNKVKGFRGLVISLYIILILINIEGIIPYRLSFSSHLFFRLLYRFPLWFLLIISRIELSWRYFFGVLLIGGLPVLINSFLSSVETVSILFRSFTLSIRITANIRAGHVVLGLLGIYGSFFIPVFTFFSFIVFIFLLTLGVFYHLFEMGVCIIQAYIFPLLLTLYSNDH